MITAWRSEQELSIRGSLQRAASLVAGAHPWDDPPSNRKRQQEAANDDEGYKVDCLFCPRPNEEDRYESGAKQHSVGHAKNKPGKACARVHAKLVERSAERALIQNKRTDRYALTGRIKARARPAEEREPFSASQVPSWLRKICTLPKL